MQCSTEQSIIALVPLLATIGTFSLYLTLLSMFAIVNAMVVYTTLYTHTQSTTAKPSAEACNSRHTNNTKATEGRPWHAKYVSTSYDW
jgi:hypothetical protein